MPSRYRQHRLWSWEMIQVGLCKVSLSLAYRSALTKPLHSSACCSLAGAHQAALLKLKCQRKCCDRLAGLRQLPSPSVTLGKNTPPLCLGSLGPEESREAREVSRSGAWVRDNGLAHARHRALLTPGNPGGTPAHPHQCKMLHPEHL